MSGTASNNPLNEMGRAARQASYELSGLSSGHKNDLLLCLADLLEARSAFVLEANRRDMEAAKAGGMSPAMQDRLLLDGARLFGIAADIRQVASLRDPVGEILEGHRLDNGILLTRTRVPLGVVAAIYEARPNVTADVASLCLKTGNAVILRGGKETVHSNAAIVEVIKEALVSRKLPSTCVQSITDPDRALVTALLQLDQHVDMLIPRGGAGLHNFCKEHSRIPVIIGGIGVCHIFVDESADQDASLAVLANAKVQRPSVCNALETALVHEKIAARFLPLLAGHLGKLGVTLHCSETAAPYLGANGNCVPVMPGDYDKEWLSLDLNVHVVSGVEEAIGHIREHGTGHSEAILTETRGSSERFAREVDAAAVYVNCSTRFTDGGQFGLGAEVAISTQKLHARGPMGLEALTTYKWLGVGDYTVRQ